MNLTLYFVHCQFSSFNIFLLYAFDLGTYVLSTSVNLIVPVPFSVKQTYPTYISFYVAHDMKITIVKTMTKAMAPALALVMAMMITMMMVMTTIDYISNETDVLKYGTAQPSSPVVPPKSIDIKLFTNKL